MTTTEAIAATIAAHTPIGTRYQLVAVPRSANCGELRAQRSASVRRRLNDRVAARGT
jgi:hypothetical protein